MLAYLRCWVNQRVEGTTENIVSIYGYRVIIFSCFGNIVSKRITTIAILGNIGCIGLRGRHLEVKVVD